MAEPYLELMVSLFEITSFHYCQTYVLETQHMTWISTGLQLHFQPDYP